MRRRVHEDVSANGVPLALRRYDPADWPDAECHPECAFWAARGELIEQARAADPDGWFLGEIEGGGPDEPWHPERI